MGATSLDLCMQVLVALANRRPFLGFPLPACWAKWSAAHGGGFKVLRRSITSRY